MRDTIKGFRGKDGPILLDYSGVANVPGAIQSIGALTAQPGDHFEVETVDGTGRVVTVKAVAKPGGGSGQNVELDTTLTKSGKAADAKAVGDRLSVLEGVASGDGLTAAQINALDGMFRVCAFVKDDVSAEYNAFRAAFNLDGGGETPDEPELPEQPEQPAKTLTGISATYSGGDVAAGTAVSALTGVVVTAHYTDGTSEAVTGYTLSGEIAAGENTVTVSYGGKTATFAVTGIAESSGLPHYEYTVVGSGVLTDAGTATPSSLYDVTDFMEIDPNYSTLSVATYMDAVSDARISSSTYVQWFNGDTFLSRTGGSSVIEIGKTKCTKPVTHNMPEGATRFRIGVQNNCDRFVLYKGTVSASDI